MKSRYLKALSEPELARFQTLQAGNDCALHAISAALGLLCDLRLDLEELTAEVNRLWWRGKFYRVLPGWAVAPPMQARIVNYLARSRALPIRARLLHLSPEILRNLPDDDNLAALVTIYWHRGRAPAIYRGSGSWNHNQSKNLAGHTMLIAAFDPAHTNAGHLRTPWGFINSWAAANTELFWMEDEAFRRAWGFNLPVIGRNASVVIARSSQNLPIE